MRERLIFRSGHKGRFQGVFMRYGQRYGREKTALFLEIRDAKTGTLLADHVWVTWNGLCERELEWGDVAVFSATPHLYWTMGAYTNEQDVVCFGDCREVGLGGMSRLRVVGNVLNEQPDWFKDWEQRVVSEYMASEEGQSGVVRKPVMCRRGVVNDGGRPLFRHREAA